MEDGTAVLVDKRGIRQTRKSEARKRLAYLQNVATIVPVPRCPGEGE